jgi:biopolymer transport protein ExbD
MQFIDPPRRRTAESIIPMINVVFLLLIFFLMTAEIAPPEPVAATPPLAAESAAAFAEVTVGLAADGTVGFDGLAGPEAMAAVADRLRTTPDMPVGLRADGSVPAARVAAVLHDLAALGVQGVALTTTGR